MRRAGQGQGRAGRGGGAGAAEVGDPAGVRQDASGATGTTRGTSIPQAILRGGIDKVHAAIEVEAPPAERDAHRRPGRYPRNPRRRPIVGHGMVMRLVFAVRRRRNGGGGRAGVDDRVRLDVAGAAGDVRVGLALAGSQVKRQVRRLRTDLSGHRSSARSPTAHWSGWAPCWWSCPGWSAPRAGRCLLLPPTRAALRPLLTAVAVRGIGRRMPLITVATAGGAAYANRRSSGGSSDAATTSTARSSTWSTSSRRRCSTSPNNRPRCLGDDRDDAAAQRAGAQPGACPTRPRWR